MKTVLNLNGVWNLAEKAGDAIPGPDAGWHKAAVPGDVRVSLSENGVLPRDLFWRTNIKETRWIEDREWVYRRTFEFNEDSRAANSLEG